MQGPTRALLGFTLTTQPDLQGGRTPHLLFVQFDDRQDHPELSACFSQHLAQFSPCLGVVYLQEAQRSDLVAVTVILDERLCVHGALDFTPGLSRSGLRFDSEVESPLLIFNLRCGFLAHFPGYEESAWEKVCV